MKAPVLLSLVVQPKMAFKRVPHLQSRKGHIQPNFQTGLYSSLRPLGRRSAAEPNQFLWNGIQQKVIDPPPLTDPSSGRDAVVSNFLYGPRTKS